MTMPSPRMTTGNSLNPQPTSFDNPMLEDSFLRILATGGCVPTGGRK
ncbi:hypothetical protein A33Q_1858 [Indibacter alkaliphilus LW1]|uniref:Uncharacterized protein n=1 Tax=Indibacter alkaliphilus (strain CCUG 57479 / KCTC 22604 / LW1) TaxID=1189612 RepID=S2DIB3_INDAL|nr:hypothetical protein A33Q_1858 [Indibacter alkaliphilus LW1]